MMKMLLDPVQNRTESLTKLDRMLHRHLPEGRIPVQPSGQYLSTLAVSPEDFVCPAVQACGHHIPAFCAISCLDFLPLDGEAVGGFAFGEDFKFKFPAQSQQVLAGIPTVGPSLTEPRDRPCLFHWASQSRSILSAKTGFVSLMRPCLEAMKGMTLSPMTSTKAITFWPRATLWLIPFHQVQLPSKSSDEGRVAPKQASSLAHNFSSDAVCILFLLSG